MHSGWKQIGLKTELCTVAIPTKNPEGQARARIMRRHQTERVRNHKRFLNAFSKWEFSHTQTKQQVAKQEGESAHGESQPSRSSSCGGWRRPVVVMSGWGQGGLEESKMWKAMSAPCPPGKQLDRHCADGEDEVGECMTHDQLRTSVLEVKLSGASVLSIGLLSCPISHPLPNNKKTKQFVLPAHEQAMAPFRAEQDLLLTVLCCASLKCLFIGLHMWAL